MGVTAQVPPELKHRSVKLTKVPRGSAANEESTHVPVLPSQYLPTESIGRLRSPSIGRHASRLLLKVLLGSHKLPGLRLCTTVNGWPVLYRYVLLICQPP